MISGSICTGDCAGCDVSAERVRCYTARDSGLVGLRAGIEREGGERRVSLGIERGRAKGVN